MSRNKATRIPRFLGAMVVGSVMEVIGIIFGVIGVAGLTLRRDSRASASDLADALSSSGPVVPPATEGMPISLCLLWIVAGLVLLGLGQVIGLVREIARQAMRPPDQPS